MGGKEGEGGRTKGKWRKEVKEGRHEYANFARNKPIFASEFSTKKKVAGVNVLGRSVWIFLFPDAKPILNPLKTAEPKNSTYRGISKYTNRLIRIPPSHFTGINKFLSVHLFTGHIIVIMQIFLRKHSGWWHSIHNISINPHWSAQGICFQLFRNPSKPLSLFDNFSPFGHAIAHPNVFLKRHPGQ